MPSLFTRAAQVSDRQLDRVFGEPFLVEPMGRGDDEDVNAPLQADPTRPSEQVIMTYQEAGKDYWPTARGVAANTAQRRTGAEILVSVLDGRLPYTLRAGDRVVRKATGVAYHLNAPEPDDAGRIWFPVTVARPA